VPEFDFSVFFLLIVLIPNPIPPANRNNTDSVMGTLAGSQFGLFGGHGLGGPPAPGVTGWEKPIALKILIDKIKIIENILILIYL
jgi:hypothetical protein